MMASKNSGKELFITEEDREQIFLGVPSGPLIPPRKLRSPTHSRTVSLIIYSKTGF